MQHDDLVRLLHRLATGAGAQIHLNSKVTSIRKGTRRSPRPRVTLANGDVLVADILIGADGYKSIVRDVVLGEEDCAKPGGMTLYTGVVKAEDMLQDPELRPHALADEVRSQHGLRRVIVTDPC